ncbi:MAG: hypothetical protein WC980_06165 [Candidatus Brocadiia bacterium]
MPILILVWVNLVLGLMLWLGLCSDWSLPGTKLDIILFLVACGSSVYLIIRLLLNKQLSSKKRWLYSLVCIPIFIFIFPYLLLFPFTLFYASEVAGEQFVEQAVSPDGVTTASVYFRPVGAYTGGNGYILVRIKYRYFPLVERQIYVRKTFEDEHGHFIKWLDNDTMLALERNDVIKVGWIRFHRPW